MQNKEPGFVAARDGVVKLLDHLRHTAINHPNPQEKKLIRQVTTRALLDVNVATSIKQIADIMEKAQADLEANVKPISKEAA